MTSKRSITDARLLVTRALALHGIVGARLCVQHAHYLAEDRRPLVFVRAEVPAPVEAGLRLVCDSTVRVIFSHAEQRGAA